MDFSFTNSQVSTTSRGRAHPASPRKQSPPPTLAMSPLMWAAMRQDLATVRALLAEDGNVDRQESHGWTALILAARKGDAAIVSVLLERGARPDIACVFGWTALSYAAYLGYAEIVELLLQRGADIDINTGAGGWTPLMYAAHEGRLASVKILLAGGANPHDRTEAGLTALKMALVKGHQEIASLLDAALMTECH